MKNAPAPRANLQRRQVIAPPHPPLRTFTDHPHSSSLENSAPSFPFSGKHSALSFHTHSSPLHPSSFLLTYTGWGKNRFAVVGMQNTIPVLSFINYCIIFLTNNCKPTSAPPCIHQSSHFLVSYSLFCPLLTHNFCHSPKPGPGKSLSLITCASLCLSLAARDIYVPSTNYCSSYEPHFGATRDPFFTAPRPRCGSCSPWSTRRTWPTGDNVFPSPWKPSSPPWVSKSRGLGRWASSLKVESDYELGNRERQTPNVLTREGAPPQLCYALARTV